ncbi:unnamed protein product [Pleuronectes platessa]|uniref:Uncharacterized protein n=1 Tax=Pleuronectes platessa TaxID=8262 RepID=A0A9N7V7F9_PLEPL|nr:unnamed protein product [Pleuronectes platessa]
MPRDVDRSQDNTQIAARLTVILIHSDVHMPIGRMSPKLNCKSPEMKLSLHHLQGNGRARAEPSQSRAVETLRGQTEKSANGAKRDDTTESISTFGPLEQPHNRLKL